jgi:redox-sensitive bicupin YhaK (pirin superfamily)
MMSPRYRDVKEVMIPTATPSEGVRVKVICGRVGSVEGPVRDIVIDPEYLDVTLNPGTAFPHAIKEEHTAFAYVIQGAGRVGVQEVDAESVVLFGKGDEVKVEAADVGVRFLLVAGKPLQEPVAWYGPIVMNTEDELRIALQEYQNGTFIKP